MKTDTLINLLFAIAAIGIVVILISINSGHEHGPDGHSHGPASETQGSQQPIANSKLSTHDNIDSQ